jgi:CBS domain-containing protein
MTRSLITLKADSNIFKAFKVLTANNISGAPVVDENKRLIGILSEGDCLTVVIKGSYYEEVGGLVSDFMSVEVDTIGPNDDIVDVAAKFQKTKRRRFPVVDDGDLIGQISQKDVLRAVLDFVQHPSHGKNPGHS